MFLGIDLGTGSLKAVIINEEHQTLASEAVPLSVSIPRPLWSEQSPHDYWSALQQAMSVLKEREPLLMKQVQAIGLTGQMHGAVLLDSRKEPLRPAILWNDGRSADEAKWLEENVPDLWRITGNRMMPGFTAPKLMWLRNHEPQVFASVEYILLPKDYLRLKMIGDAATDLSDASGTGWLDVGQRRWSSELIEATGISERHLPSLHEGTEITGTLLSGLAKEWGLSEGVLVVAGGSDNAATAVGSRTMHSGKAFLSLGTSGVYFVSDDRYRYNPEGGVHSMCHCIPGLWHHMTVHLSAASSLSWLAKVTGGQSVKTLLEEAQQRPPSTEIFLPYLSGERSPHNNPYAQGVFFGLTHNTQRGDLTNAVLEGVAFAFLDGQDAFHAVDIAIDEVSVVGGGANSAYWGTILASVLGRTLMYRKQRESGAALGAALLAYLGVNVLDNEIKTSPQVEWTVAPDEARREIYGKKHQKFKELYRSVKHLYQTLGCNLKSC
ncbi:MAG: xylulokinase [Chlamydiia bacterium]|nr:xylulokinase [Chlamydiia bacterium]